MQLTFDDTLVGGNGPKIETATTPVVGLEVGLPLLSVTVSKSQYCNAINFTSFLSNFSLRFENRQHRPQHSVTDDPRAWWLYAINSIRDDVRKRMDRVSWKNMLHKHMLYKRYTKLWKLKDSTYAKKMKLKQTPNPEKNDTIKQFFQTMEDELSVAQVMEYREKAEEEVEKWLEEEKNKKAHSRKKSGGGMFSGWFGR